MRQMAMTATMAIMLAGLAACQSQSVDVTKPDAPAAIAVPAAPRATQTAQAVGPETTSAPSTASAPATAASQPEKPAPVAVAPKPAPAAPAPTPVVVPIDGPIMAKVNGRPIPMKTLSDILVREHGMSIAYQLIADELVAQEAAAQKITVTPADVKKESDFVMIRALGEMPSENQRERTLTELMNQFRVSPTMWDMLMRRQALLRKIIEPQVKVTQEDLRAEFGVQYDRKYTVRDIQTSTVGDAESSLNRLKALAKEGKGVSEDQFAAEARSVSTGFTSSSGGLLPPVSAKTKNVPVAVIEASMKLKKPGDMSGIVQSGTAFHILYLVKIEEPQNVKFEDVREKLAVAVRERQVAQLQQQHLGELIKDARKAGRIEFMDATLKSQDVQAPDESGK